MLNKKTNALVVFISLFLYGELFAGPHPLKNDPFGFKLGHDLSEYAGKSTMLQLMKKEIHPELVSVARAGNEGSAKAGPKRNKAGVAVKINDQNFFYHVGYPESDQGGRSYGWTKGQRMGDWSDKKYLDELDRVVRTSDSELNAFYRANVQLIGACNAESYPSMRNAHTQLVATNFLAIYGAEQYRALEGNSRWDDALFQVTMVAAVHGGQKRLTKFYRGKFSDTSFEQDECVYDEAREGEDRVKAELNDYWQFGKTCGGRSGINITRRDFEKMGTAITSFYKAKRTANSDNFSELQNRIKASGSNIIEDVSDYFIQKRGDNLGAVDGIANATADFLVGVRKDAEAITTYTASGR